MKLRYEERLQAKKKIKNHLVPAGGLDSLFMFSMTYSHFKVQAAIQNWAIPSIHLYGHVVSCKTLKI